MSYTWDNNGNLLSNGVFSYTYDYANRLVSVEDVTTTVVYTYNGDGHRMAQAVGGVTTTYVVAVLGLSQVLVETTGGDSIVYLYGHDLLGEEGTTWAWHLGDGLGSVRQLADSNGHVTLAQGYTPFGVPLWDEGSGLTGYGFTGERWEAYSQLLFLRARYYQPGTGRFISKDPWEGSLRSPGTLNPYVYVENRVATRVDPSGLRSIAQSPIAGNVGFEVPDCGPGCWFFVSRHKFYSSPYYTPVEWEFPPPTDQVHIDLFPDESGDLVIPGTGEQLKKLTVHPDFWADVQIQGGGRLNERNEPGEPYVPRGTVLRYHKGLARNPTIAGGNPRVLWTVAMDKRYLHLYGSLKWGDRICILELTALTPYHGNFRYEDEGRVRDSPTEEYWLDIYVGEGKQSITRYSFASTGKKKYRFTVLRAGKPGETCPCGMPQPY